MIACPSVPERPSLTRFLVGAEAAFRDALTASVAGLALGDRNLLRFHYFHGLPVERLADMFCVPRPAMVRQLARIRERLLRDTRHRLAAQLPADKDALDRLIEVARSRFDVAVARVL
jgi:RNA polymerase sigma-70 factor, ECF subfamily